MSQSMLARFRVLLSGNVASESRKTGDNFDAMARRGTRAMSRLRASAASLDRGVGMMTSRFGAMAGAFAGAQGLRNAMSAEERLERLGVAAGRSSQQMQAAMSEIRATAADEDIRIDPNEILAGIEAIQEKVGDFDLAQGLRREIGLAIQATGSGGQEIGALVAAIAQKFDIETPEGMKQALDLLAVQGKEGAVELNNLARLGPKVFAAYGSFGKKGVAGLAEAGGLMQIFMRGVGSADQAATVFENVFNTLGDAKKIAKLKKFGIAIEDETGKMKKPVELLKTIIETAGGDDMKLGAVFDAESLRGIRQLSKLYRETGAFGELDAIINVKADGSTLEADASRLAQTTSAAYDTSVALVEAKSQELLAEPMQALAKALRGLDEERLDKVVSMGKGLTAAVVAFKTVKMGVGAYSGVRSIMGEGRGAARLGPLADLAKPMPVFVTNPGFGKGMGGAPAAGAGAAAAGGGTAAGAAAARSASDQAMSRARVAEAESNAGGRARFGSAAGAVSSIGMVAAIQGDVDAMFARRDDLVSKGMDRAEAFERAQGEMAAQKNEDFENLWGVRHLLGAFGRGDEETPEVDAEAEEAEPKNPARQMISVPENPAKMAIYGSASVTPAPAPQALQSFPAAHTPFPLPQSTPAATLGDDRAVEALEDMLDEARESRSLLEELTRVKPSASYPQSRPGNSHRIMGAP